MDILSVSCKITLLENKDRSVNLEIVRDEDGKQIWKVAENSKDSLFVPAPRRGTWTHGSPLPSIWLWIHPEGEEAEKTLLAADGISSNFLFDAACGRSLTSERAVYYGGTSTGQDVSCKFSLWCI